MADTVERGERQLDRLEASRVMIDRVTLLHKTEGAELQPIIDAFATADAMIGNVAVAEQGRAQLQRLEQVVDRMIEYADARIAAL